MTELHAMSGTQVMAAIGDGRASVLETAQSCLARIADREPVVRAFAHLDPELVAGSARALDEHQHRGALAGLPISIKDLMDTAGEATEYGSAIYQGHVPTVDASIVERLRKAGALLTGKTVTTEFALFNPGATTNPWNPLRTPGGSSSGSAAAVADNMVPVALGTQTAGSIIRPASFCGVVGFKPSFGDIDRAGVKPVSPSLDTIGLFAREVGDIRTVFRALRTSRVDPSAPERPTGKNDRLRLGVLRTGNWARVEAHTRNAFDALVENLGSASCIDLADVDTPDGFDDLADVQNTLMEYEVAQCLETEFNEHQDLMHESTRQCIERGRMISAANAHEAKELAQSFRARLPEFFGEFDAFLTPATVGEAPELSSTGDPLLCRAWTLLHGPAISLPLLTGESGLPVGLQLVGPAKSDDALLHIADAVTREAQRA